MTTLISTVIPAEESHFRLEESCVCAVDAVSLTYARYCNLTVPDAVLIATWLPFVPEEDDDLLKTLLCAVWQQITGFSVLPLTMFGRHPSVMIAFGAMVSLRRGPIDSALGRGMLLDLSQSLQFAYVLDPERSGS